MPTLGPAACEDVLLALGYSLQFGLTGKPHKLTDHQRPAESQAAYLERGGFVLMRKTGATAARNGVEPVTNGP